MENRFEQNPEEQVWRAPLPPRPASPSQSSPQTGAPNAYGTVNGATAHGTTANGTYVAGQPAQDLLRGNLCAWVCEKLSDLLDNDGSVRPEQAAGIYAHLAICRACAHEFEEMQQVVSLVEHLPPAELPCDFSVLIMHRIEHPNAPALQRTLHVAPNLSVSSAVVMTSPAHDRHKSASVPSQTAANTAANVVSGVSSGRIDGRLEQKSVVKTEQQVVQTETLHQTHKTEVQLSQAEKLGRITAGGILSSGLGYLISSAWGRQMLNGIYSPVSAWFGQFAILFRDAPGLTWVLTLIFSALAELGGLLGHTYQTLAPAVATGITLDVLICVFAYSVLSARRREAQMRLY